MVVCVKLVVRMCSRVVVRNALCSKFPLSTFM